MKSAAIAHEALAGGGTVRELVIAQGLMDEAELDSVLSPQRLSGLSLATGIIILPPIDEDPEQAG